MTAKKKPDVALADQPKKRQLRTAPTLREQVNQAADKPVKRRKSLLTLPFRFIFGSIAKLLRALGQSRFGQVIKSIYLSRPFTPIRFIVRLLKKVLFVNYFVNAYRELLQVTWPDTRTTWRLTGAVLIFAITFGLIIAGLDYVLENVFRKVLLGS